MDMDGELRTTLACLYKPSNLVVACKNEKSLIWPKKCY